MADPRPTSGGSLRGGAASHRRSTPPIFITNRQRPGTAPPIAGPGVRLAQRQALYPSAFNEPLAECDGRAPPPPEPVLPVPKQRLLLDPSGRPAGRRPASAGSALGHSVTQTLGHSDTHATSWGTLGSASSSRRRAGEREGVQRLLVTLSSQLVQSHMDREYLNPYVLGPSGAPQKVPAPVLKAGAQWPNPFQVCPGRERRAGQALPLFPPGSPPVFPSGCRALYQKVGYLGPVGPGIAAVPQASLLLGPSVDMAMIPWTIAP